VFDEDVVQLELYVGDGLAVAPVVGHCGEREKQWRGISIWILRHVISRGFLPTPADSHCSQR
jgi:hypothetical protein